jgi:uncharacterized membrane protein YhaH (DUF805 family)
LNNPYSAPDANLSETDLADETYQPKFFSLKGRIGRVRYFAYSYLSIFLLMFVAGLLAAIVIPLTGGGNGSSAAAIVFLIALYVPMIAIGFVMMIRRLNDLNQSGWLSLLMLVPLLNFFFALYLMFGAGTSGANKYGPKPAKNSTLMVIGALLPIILVVLMALIAIPQYQKYVERAKHSSQQQQDKAVD